MEVFKKFVTTNKRLCDLLTHKFPNFFLDDQDNAQLFRAILNHYFSSKCVSTVVEVGGIDRPLLNKSKEWRYIGVDIEYRPNCEQIYDEFFLQTIEKPVNINADLVISYTLLEHVPDNKSALANIFESLNQGGSTAHYLPSKFHPYSLILRLVGPTWQKRLIKLLRPHAVATTGYPAYFDYCSVAQMRNLFIDVGFKNVKVIPFYKANDYFSFFVPLFITVAIYENLVKFCNMKAGACGFIICADKV
jgi:hypothetical protein